MRALRCRWYDDEGVPIGGGCFKQSPGNCAFVHPSEPGWPNANRTHMARPYTSRGPGSSNGPSGRSGFGKASTARTSWAEPSSASTSTNSGDTFWGEPTNNNMSSGQSLSSTWGEPMNAPADMSSQREPPTGPSGRRGGYSTLTYNTAPSVQERAETINWGDPLDSWAAPPNDGWNTGTEALWGATTDGQGKNNHGASPTSSQASSGSNHETMPGVASVWGAAPVNSHDFTSATSSRPGVASETSVACNTAPEKDHGSTSATNFAWGAAPVADREPMSATSSTWGAASETNYESTSVTCSTWDAAPEDNASLAPAAAWGSTDDIASDWGAAKAWDQHIPVEADLPQANPSASPSRTESTSWDPIPATASMTVVSRPLEGRDLQVDLISLIHETVLCYNEKARADKEHERLRQLAKSRTYGHASQSTTSRLDDLRAANAKQLREVEKELEKLYGRLGQYSGLMVKSIAATGAAQDDSVPENSQSSSSRPRRWEKILDSLDGRSEGDRPEADSASRRKRKLTEENTSSASSGWMCPAEGENEIQSGRTKRRCTELQQTQPGTSTATLWDARSSTALSAFQENDREDGEIDTTPRSSRASSLARASEPALVENAELKQQGAEARNETQSLRIETARITAELAYIRAQLERIEGIQWQQRVVPDPPTVDEVVDRVLPPVQSAVMADVGDALLKIKDSIIKTLTAHRQEVFTQVYKWLRPAVLLVESLESFVKKQRRDSSTVAEPMA